MTRKKALIIGGAIGGETRLQTIDYDGAADRYDLEVTGGASKISIDTR